MKEELKVKIQKNNGDANTLMSTKRKARSMGYTRDELKLKADNNGYIMGVGPHKVIMENVMKKQKSFPSLN